MAADQRPASWISEIIAGLKRLPDVRAAVEALLLFILVLAAGGWAASTGMLALNPMSEDQQLTVYLSAFLIPALGEEIVFRGWLRKGAPLAAIISLLAYVAWHPIQTLAGLPFGRSEFLDPRFLAIIALLGAACTLSRIRSGSVWPAVVIHWGVVVIWKNLYGG